MTLDHKELINHTITFKMSNEITCAICQDDEVYVRPATNLGPIIMTPCTHGFHEKCMDQVFEHGHNSCPLCRKEISKEEWGIVVTAKWWSICSARDEAIALDSGMTLDEYDTKTPEECEEILIQAAQKAGMSRKDYCVYVDTHFEEMLSKHGVSVDWDAYYKI
jgi:hypothetical protein